MEKQWRKLCKGLILLLFATAALASKESTLLESLKCYNDYDKNLFCTWSERREAVSIIPMKLYHWTNHITHTQPSPVECKHASNISSSSLIEWTCHKEVDIFTVSTKDMFMFKPERQLEVKAHIDLYKIIKPQQPLNLSVTMEKNGDFMLKWETTYGNHTTLLGQLQAEVSYKRDSEPWEDAHSVLLSEGMTYLQLQKTSLVPGSRYAARVRLKPHNKSKFMGQWSSWSSEVTWQTPKGDEAEPKNLQCTFDGIDQLECSWEVRREVTESILFALHYTDETADGSREMECMPVHFKENLEIIHYHCALNITNASNLNNYQIVIQPKETIKKINPSSHIKCKPPYNLTVQSNPENDNYKLTWKTTNISYNIAQEFEILYKKLEEPWEVAELLKLEYDTTEYFFSKKKLDSSSVYVAKIKVKVKKNDAYNGLWSDWSQPVQWETQKEFELWLLMIIFIPAIAIATALAFYYGYARLKSAKSIWDDSIPDPRKSKLWGNIHHGSLLKLYSSSPDLFNISPVTTVERSKIPVLIAAGLFDNYLVKCEICQSSVNLSHHPSESVKPNQQSTSTKAEFRPTCPLVCSACDLSIDNVSSADSTATLHAASKNSEVDHWSLYFTGNYFNRSYLACPLVSSLPNVISEIQKEEQSYDPKANSKGYATLPQCHSESRPLPESQSHEAQLPIFADYLETPPQASAVSLSFAFHSAFNTQSHYYKYKRSKSQILLDEKSQDDNKKSQTTMDSSVTDRPNSTVCLQSAKSNYIASKEMDGRASLPDDALTPLPPSNNDYVMNPPGQDCHFTHIFPAEGLITKEKKQSHSNEGNVFLKLPDCFLSEESARDLTCYGNTKDTCCAVTDKSPAKQISKDILIAKPLTMTAEEPDQEKSLDYIMTHDANDIMCLTSVASNVQSSQQRKEDPSGIPTVKLQADPTNLILVHPSGDYCITAKSHNYISVTPQQEFFKEVGTITAQQEDPSVRQGNITVSQEEDCVQADQVKTRYPEAAQNCLAITDYVCLPYRSSQELHYI